MRKIDLHTHTNISDGKYSPEELIDMAIEREISALAITDHDTVAGLERGLKYAAEKNFNLIPGIEFSLGFSGGSFHLLGLYIDHNNRLLNETIEQLLEARRIRAVKIVEDLNLHGIHISYDEVEEEVKDGAVGKPHIARVMVNRGYAADMQEVFANYMLKGKPGYVKKENISVEKAISVIKGAGGISIVAHPASLRFNYIEQFDHMVKELVEMGLEGIEAYSTMHSMEEVFEFYKIATKYRLLISGGSDFHGDKKEELGTFSEGRYIPVEVIDGIESYRRNLKRS